jgi:hypothetical protein
MDETKKSAYQFVGYPVKCKREDYINAVKKIGEIHQDIEAIHSIYRFGSVSTYGISDIDYFIVTQDSLDLPTFTYTYPKKKMTKKERYIMYHRPVAIIPLELFESLSLFCPIFEIECIYGENLMKKRKESENISKELATIYLSDAFFMLYPNVFIRILSAKKIHVRNALTVMKKIEYLLRLLKILGKTKKSWSNYTLEVKKIRETWFKKKEEGIAEKKLPSLLQAGLLIVMDMIHEYDVYCSKNEECEDTGKKEQASTFISRKRQAIFLRQYKKDEAIKEMKDFYKKNNMFVSILPESIARQLTSYKESNTLFGDYIGEYLNTKEKCSEEKVNSTINIIRKERAIALSKALIYAVKINYRAGCFGVFSIGCLDHKGWPNVVRDGLWEFFQENKVKKRIKFMNAVE